jgi:lipid-A-disaccharide synthase
MSKSIYIIAGETSGDVLGARLMYAMGSQTDLNFNGIGGAMMAQNGLQSLFPMDELSVMGIFEIIPKIPHLLKRINETAKDIIARQPNIVVTIDSPDFCKRVVKKVRANCPNTKFIHYVAPTVWAWRESRAEVMADLFDGLICLLPFEPPYFEKYALKAQFCGHPIVEAMPDEQFERNPTEILILPGSRRGEVTKMAPVFADVFRRLKANHQSLQASIVALPYVKDIIDEAFNDVDVQYIAPESRYEAFQTAGFAIATSGTVGLELAVAGCPHIVAYKMNPLTYLVGKMLVKTKYAHLINIMEKRMIIPEFIQGQCNADDILKGLDSLDKQDLSNVRTQLNGSNTNIPPSMQAANFVLSYL